MVGPGLDPHDAAMTSIETHPPTARINPTAWSQRFGYDQGQLRTGVTSVLTIAGQGPVDADGRLLHEGDVPAQMALALANVAAVVEQAGMRMADVAMLRIHVTDLDAAFAAYDIVVEHLASVGSTAPATLVEVSRLALPGMVVEIDGLALA